MTVTGLILAGTRPGGDPLAEAEGVAHKSLLKVDGEPILLRVVAALKAAEIDRIVVSTDNAELRSLAEHAGVETIAAATGPSESVAQAFEKFGAPMLVTTSDHALLSGEWVHRFLDDTPAGADLAVLMAARESVEAAVPGTQRTWLKFADGHWSGCNLFLLSTVASAKTLDLWRHVEADRKRPWRIARRLGVGTLASYALGRLALADGIGRLGKRIGLDARLVKASDGLAAIDVDKHADLELVRRLASKESE